VWTTNGGKSAEGTVGEWACPAQGFSNHTHCSVQSYKKRGLIAGDIINLKAAIKHPGFTTKTWTLSVQNYITVPPNGKVINTNTRVHIYIYI
jgi:hypothetical protein